MEKRNSTIDLAKYVASVMIVAIHTGLFSDVNENLSFVVVNIVCRLAVPFFAVCSGYFIGGRLEFDKTMLCSSHNKAVFIKQWKKLILLYGVWSVIYLFHSIPMWIEIGWFSPFAFVDYAIGAVTNGSHYHFWYLWGMIYTLPVFYGLLRICKRKFWIPVVTILWLFKVLGYSYTMLVPEQVAGILGRMGTLVCLLPLLLVGVVLRVQQEKPLRFYLTGFLLSAAGLTAEALMLREIGQDAVSYIVFTIPVAYFLFGTILKIKMCGNSKQIGQLGAVSMFIYCVHPILVELTENTFQNSLIHFAFAAAGSTVLGLVYIYIRKKMNRKKVKLCST